MWNKLDFLKMLMYLGWLISKMMGDAKKYHLLARGYVHVVCFFVCFRVAPSIDYVFITSFRIEIGFYLWHVYLHRSISFDICLYFNSTVCS